ncbi:MAG: arylsulfatase A [Verrucomicrobiales bacterium]|jgi:arylsulfatase A
MKFLTHFVLLWALLFAAAEAKTPNIVVIFLDDSAWADFEPFGIPAYKTPHVSQLAKEGRRFNQLYVPQAICSASRAALLSGCFPGRTKVFGAHGPNGRGLDPKFTNIAEMLKKKDYQTAIFGKWHVGDQPETRPAARGFDESAGLMYSNDMWEFHPESPEHWGKFPLMYYENNKVIIDRVTKEHQPFLTTWYTEKAVDFIGRNKENPFFLYVPHSMPHVPLFVSEKFAGKSGAGLLGDVLMEIDWSVGQINKALKDNGLEDNTMLVFTSDNGPWVSYGNHAGSTPFREAKGTSFDGGIRSACIVKYSGQLKAGSVSEDAWCTVDLMPTIAHLTEASLPEHPIDGKNVWPLIKGEAHAKNPNKYYAFSNGSDFQGVIRGDGHWKLHLPHTYRTLVDPANDGQAGKYRQARIEVSLFDLEKDPYETTNVAAQNPKIFSELHQLAIKHREKFYTK